MEKYFNYVHKKNFEVENLVLKKVFIADKEMSCNSLGPKCEGSYTVSEFVGSRAYMSAGEDGKQLKHSKTTYTRGNIINKIFC